MASKKKRPVPKKKPARTSPAKLLDGLDEAQRLVGRVRWVEAEAVLRELDRQFPDREEVLRLLLDVTHQTGDLVTYQRACERLCRLRPDEPRLLMVLGASCSANGFIALALEAWRRFLARCPDDPEAPRIRTLAADLERGLAAMGATVGVEGPDALELAGLHDMVRNYLERGNYRKARETAEMLLRRRPDFTPALNNAAEAWFREGSAERAIAMAQRALEVDPDNVHATANMTRYLCLSGRIEEAGKWAKRLKANPVRSPDAATKIAEALSHVGDDQGVLDALTAVEEAGFKTDHPSFALLFHLAAVAACRLGQEEKARRCWDTTLRLQHGFELAVQNLEDLKQPAEKRHGAWPFSISHWIRKEAIESLVARLPRGEASGGKALQQAARAHPEVARLVPMLLDRGDPPAQEFAVMFAEVVATPDLLRALRDFALGQRGSDKLRMRAAQAAAEAGLVASGPTRMWLQGEWRELLLLGWELHGEPTQRCPAQVEPLVRAGLEALHAREGRKAESLFQKALDVAPNEPSLLFNLAAAYQVQERDAESDALIHNIHERHPDYFFAITGAARLLIREGQLDRARALVDPLMRRRRLHFSEFANLCDVEIELLLARGEVEAARTWFGLLEQACPDHINVPLWRERLKPSLWKRLTGRGGT